MSAKTSMFHIIISIATIVTGKPHGGAINVINVNVNAVTVKVGMPHIIIVYL